MITLEKMVNSVSCAINVLEGTDGGYSAQDKMYAKMTLIQLKSELVEELGRSHHDPSELSVRQTLFIGKAEVR